ncbi:MAG: hypothetical protein WCC92_04455, partial [Candidatus Korobacteraceae bacterium]
PLSHAARVLHRGTSHYGDGSLNSEVFTPPPPVQNPNGATTTTMEVCEDSNGLDSCGAPHSFIYQVQLGNSDPGTISAITLTVNGQSAFVNSPNYGVLICDPDGAPGVPCSPIGAALTDCADSDSFVVNETGVGTPTYSQTWNFAASNCPAFVAGRVLAIFVDLCVNDNDDSGCAGTGNPYIQRPVLVTIDVSVQFVAVTPCRVADTRNPNGPFGGPSIQGGTSRDFYIPQSACNIPVSAAAYSLNVAVVPRRPLGYLTVWPTGEPQPRVATLNSLDGRIKANAAIVQAGDSGGISVYASDTTDVVLDINGYFAPIDNSTLAFYPLNPCRVADTRNQNGWLGGPYLQGGHDRVFPVLDATSCEIPSTAQAYSLNFSAIPRGGPLSYMTVWAAGQQRPLVSTLNAPTGTITANAAIVQAGDGGDITTYVTNDTDLVIDINGYFAPFVSGGLSLYPLPPCRVLDTRSPYGGDGPFSGTLSPAVNVVNSPCGVPISAQAYVFNATVVPMDALYYLTLWPDSEGRPLVSILNALDGAITSNMAIVRSLDGKIDAFAAGTTNLILDISSYFAP